MALQRIGGVEQQFRVTWDLDYGGIQLVITQSEYLLQAPTENAYQETSSPLLVKTSLLRWRQEKQAMQ